MGSRCRKERICGGARVWRVVTLIERDGGWVIEG